MPTPTDTREQRDHRTRSRLRRLLKTRQPIALDGLDLLAHDRQTRQVSVTQLDHRDQCALLVKGHK